MRHAVVAFPVLAEADSRIIEELRRRHDPDAGRIAAHFTLVFPTVRTTVATLADRVNVIAAKTAPIAFELRRVIVHVELPAAYVYLVPDRGHDKLIGLHARLNADARTDPSGPRFLPHVTAARLSDRQEARALATALAKRRLAIDGLIRALSLVEVTDGTAIRTIDTAPLQG